MIRTLSTFQAWCLLVSVLYSRASVETDQIRHAQLWTLIAERLIQRSHAGKAAGHRRRPAFHLHHGQNTFVRPCHVLYDTYMHSVNRDSTQVHRLCTCEPFLNRSVHVHNLFAIIPQARHVFLHSARCVSASIAIQRFSQSASSLSSNCPNHTSVHPSQPPQTLVVSLTANLLILLKIRPYCGTEVNVLLLLLLLLLLLYSGK